MMRVLLLALLACLLLGGRAEAGCPPLPYVFVPGTTADANQVNANFNAVTTCAGAGSITVLNLTALRAACTSTTGCPAGHLVFLNGVIRLTDGVAGAPPLYFSVGSGACSTDDGASCVNSANGNQWDGVFPPGGADVREWSVVPDGTTDNKTTLQAALNWVGATGGPLFIPPGTVYSSVAVTLTPPTGGAATIVGAGADTTYFKGPATGAVNFLNVALSNQVQSFHLRDFTCLAAGPAATEGACISAVQSGTITNPAIAAQSDITRVNFQGADQYLGSDCWAYDFKNQSVSDINFVADNFTGCLTPAGAGIYLQGASTAIGVVYNVSGGKASGHTYGIYNGAYIQGLTVDQFNMVDNTNSIYVPPSVLGLAQLTVSNSQCGDNSFCINDNVGVPGLALIGDLIYVNNSGNIGVNLADCNYCNITGNSIQGLTTTNTTGFALAGSAHVQGTVTGNTFFNLNVGVQLGTGANIYLGSNVYTNVVTKITNSSNGILSQVIDAPVSLASTQVSGAVSGTGGLVELTVGSTANFVSGQLCLISGVGGILDISNSAVSYIAIIDATHVLLQGIAFSGSYTSGGFLAALR